MSGTVYLPGDSIPITDVGDSFPPGDTNDHPGPSLVCVTSNVNTMCCRGGDHPGNGSVGNWFYPNGTIVLGNNANPNGEVPTPNKYVLTGRDLMCCSQLEYTCEVPDGPNTAMNHTVNITLGECTHSNYVI